MNLDEIKNMRVRYQPIILPDGTVIPKKSSVSIIDSRKKIEKLCIPKDLTGKTVLDIGCSEGFFLRESIARGASHATGIEFQKERAEACRFVNNLWGYDKKIDVRTEDYMETQGEWDVVLCFSVIHHRVKNRDTWSALIKRDGYKEEYETLMKGFRKVASLAREMVLFEFPYTYRRTVTSKKEVDYELLCDVLEKENIFKRIEYKGLSDKLWWCSKDRYVYVAYK